MKQLEQWIVEQEFVSIDEICERFGVHVNTARADIKELVRKGVAEKQYGGVRCVKTALPTTFVERDQTKRSVKEIIGEKAARFLEEGDVIFVDAGTTTAQLFSKERSLPKHLTVITNNLNVVYWVLNNTDYLVFILPGKIERQLNSIASLETIDSIKNYNIQKAFIGCRRIAANGALTSASSVDAKVKETVISMSQYTYLMADSEKIGPPELYSFSDLSQIDYWICDKNTEMSEEVAKNNNIKLV